MFAQNLLEYGALSTRTTLNQWLYDFQDWIQNASFTTWIIIGGLFMIGLWFSRRHRG